MNEPRRSERSIAASEDGSTVIGDVVALDDLDVESNRPTSTRPEPTGWKRVNKIPVIGTVVWKCVYCVQSLKVAMGRHKLSPKAKASIRPGQRTVDVTAALIDILIVEALPCAYPRLAAFIDADPNFMIYRRFGYLRARLILNQQDKLTAIETALDKCDEADNHGERDFLRSRAADMNRPVRHRQDLFRELHRELKTYDELILRAGEITQLDRPQERNRAGVCTLIENDGQLCEPDRDYLEHVDDLIALGGDKERSLVHGLIEEYVTKLTPDFSRRLFQDPILALKSSKTLEYQLYTKSRFDKVVSFLFTMIIVGGIMIPVFILYLLRCRSGNVQNAVTLGFTTFFALLCSTCTTAKRHEVFAATAAYCAVLVVFTSQPDKDGC